MILVILGVRKYPKLNCAECRPETLLIMPDLAIRGLILFTNTKSPRGLKRPNRWYRKTHFSPFYAIDMIFLENDNYSIGSRG